jgi:hypothetical protein
MNKKTILIGLGVLAVAGIGYYMWKKKNETTSGASGCGCGCEEKSADADGEYSNYVEGSQLYNDCVYAKLEKGGISIADAKKACLAASVRKTETNYSNAQAGGNKCDCFNGILTDSFGNVLKGRDGKNITCKCADSTSAE